MLGQIRPTTGQTLYRSDWVGDLVEVSERPLVARCLELGEIMDGEVMIETHREPVRELCIPVRHRGHTVGVLARESAPTIGRPPGELERTYVEVFNRFARMIASGEFPFPGPEALSEEAPRVGDGVILLDESTRVEYTSPNAVSALHRIGVHLNTEGVLFSELGLNEDAVRTRVRQAAPGDRGDRARPRDHAVDPVHPPARPRAGLGRARAAYATSPSCADATAC